MKKIWRLIAAITALTMMMSCVVFAADTTGIDLFSVSLLQGQCTISGRAYTAMGSGVTVKVQEQGSSSAPLSLSAVTDTNGVFSVTFSGRPVDYQVNITTEQGKSATKALPLSAAADLFTAHSGYDITGISFTDDVFILSGTHTGTAGGRVTLKVTDPDKTGVEALKTVEQVTSDSSKAFSIPFKVDGGSYILRLEANGLEGAEYTFQPDGLVDVLSVTGAKLYPLTEQIAGYLATLESLISRCQEEGMPTDYETANYEIIKESLNFIRLEASKGYTERLPQYLYALSRIYTETAENLNSYLDGTKTPVAVPKYLTGDITLDGTTLTANTLTNGVEEERPVFFVGYGNFETACELIPMYSKIGVNMIATDILRMNRVLSAYDTNIVKDWYLQGSVDAASTFTRTNETSASGSYSIKATNPQTINHAYHYLQQTVAVEPNTTYVLGLKAKGTGITDTWFAAQDLDMVGREQIINSADWKDYSLEYTTGPDETSLLINITVCGTTTEVYFDDVYCVKKGTSENLFKNADFETARDPKTALEVEAEQYGLYIDQEWVDKYRQLLQAAEDYNIMVSAAVSPHYMPQFLYDRYPDAKDDTNFLPFNPENQDIRNAISIFARFLGSLVADYDSVYDIGLLNEAQFYGFSEDADGNKIPKPYWNDRWHAYLEEKYGTIQNLNKAYGLDGILDQIHGNDYDSFAEVAMPTSVQASPVFTDYYDFSTGILTEFQEWLAGEVRKTAPDRIKIHSKVMQYTNSAGRYFMVNGSDYEQIADSMDLNGCDTNSNYQGSNPFSSKMMWYDFMTSVKDAPVWDTESHNMLDLAEIEYDELLPYYVSADLWDGAVHGRGASIMWVWDYDEFGVPWGSSSYMNTNYAFRPGAVAENSKISMDMQRLSKEITAIAEEEAKVGLLFSRTGLMYGTGSGNITDLYDVYEQILFSGQKVGIVSDNMPEEISKYQLLVIPDNVTNIPADMLNAIKAYQENGGKVLILGSGTTLSKDEYNKAHNSTTVSYIMQHADTTATVSQKVQEMELSEIVLIDVATGEKAEGIEWSYAKYGNKYVVNILNYSMDVDDVKNVKLQLNGRDLTGVKELRSGTVSNVFAAKPYQPMLMEIEPLRLDLVDANGTVLESNLSSIKSGKIRCESLIAGDVVLALYKDETLIKASVKTGELDVAITESGSYRLMATVWDMETLEPLTDSRNLTMEVEK